MPRNWLKVISLAVLGYVLVNGSGNAARQLAGVLNLPKRLLTLHELKQLDRLLTYALVASEARDNRGLETTLRAFCAQQVKSVGRDAAEDYWQTPYRVFCRGRLIEDDEIFRLQADERDKFVVVSAGSDRKFITTDDLTSRQSGHAEVDRLQEIIRRRSR